MPSFGVNPVTCKLLPKNCTEIHIGNRACNISNLQYHKVGSNWTNVFKEADNVIEVTLFYLSPSQASGNK